MANIKVSNGIKFDKVVLEDYCKNDVNYVDQIVKEAARQMQEEMDRHILAMVFKEDGWLEVVVDPWKHNSTSAIESWCDNHVKTWYRSGNNFLFKFPEDATLFLLRWS